MLLDYTLVLSRLSKSYRAGVLGCTATVEVLREVSLKVRANEFATIEGGGGSGKTTLLLCAAGMLRPSDGDARWPSLPPRQHRPPEGIAYAAERAPMYGFLTVRESLAYAATVRELHAPGPSRDIAEILDIAALSPYAELRLGLLSETERSRMLVALALIGAPRLLLVDDLSGGADAVGRTAFIRMLARVAASGVSVLWAARAIGAVGEANSAYTLQGGTLGRTQREVRRPPRRVSLELDTPMAGRAAALLAPQLRDMERRGDVVLVPLDGKSAEEVLALCKELAIPVRASRIVHQ